MISLLEKLIVAEQFLTPFCTRGLHSLQYLQFSTSQSAVDKSDGNIDRLRDLRPVVGMQNNALHVLHCPVCFSVFMLYIYAWK